MKFLQVGLGSMGKRRIRCLKALGENDIIAFDLRKERRKQAAELYQVPVVSDFSQIDLKTIDAMLISVPPDKHCQYIKIAVENNIPAFIEASVVLDELESLNAEAKKKKLALCPSCTLRFHPAIQDIKSLVEGGKYGQFTNFSFHSGQYLPDWHPWEKVSDFYVSQKETGGGREIVPFELTWLVDVLGWPLQVKSFYGRTMEVGADIDDSYAMSLKFKNGVGTMVVDVASRFAIRKLILNMEYGQIQWDWDDGRVRVYEAETQRWIEYYQPEMQAAQGYNKNIGELMYIREIQAFINQASGKGGYPSNLDDDIRILKLLLEGEAN